MSKLSRNKALTRTRRRRARARRDAHRDWLTSLDFIDIWEMLRVDGRVAPDWKPRVPLSEDVNAPLSEDARRRLRRKSGSVTQVR
jgi:hypothetical protein